ncbi:hypothetical protein L3X38_016588 [Prunus dulcis]|uniref:Uncharacterized protein n=1 Tax=Prunus dulcis TaxID=3755 RepID=A0AAD4W7I2_PRUDU|nr:hypothetical protein L3X38_016588 [Prunus dulcis]
MFPLRPFGLGFRCHSLSLEFSSQRQSQCNLFCWAQRSQWRWFPLQPPCRKFQDVLDVGQGACIDHKAMETNLVGLPSLLEVSNGTFVGLVSDKRSYFDDLLLEVCHAKRPILVPSALSVRGLE